MTGDFINAIEYIVDSNGYHIQDKNREIIHYMNGRKGKLMYMALNIDMTKAYDRVDWEGALKEIMSMHVICNCCLE